MAGGNARASRLRRGIRASSGPKLLAAEPVCSARPCTLDAHSHSAFDSRQAFGAAAAGERDQIRACSRAAGECGGHTATSDVQRSKTTVRLESVPDGFRFGSSVCIQRNPAGTRRLK